MRRFLKAIRVIQERKERTRLNSYTYMRLNPYNPLTYLAMIIGLILGVIMFGLVGIKDEIDKPKDYFKWQ